MTKEAIVKQFYEGTKCPVCEFDWCGLGSLITDEEEPMIKAHYCGDEFVEGYFLGEIVNIKQ